LGQSSISKNDSTKNKLDEIIITGTKTERVLSSLPLNASIIKKEEIKKTNATRLSDIINEELGLITVSDFGGGEGIQMQGLDSEYTLILIDNQPLIGRSAGTLDLNRISVGNIKQIEIVRGPSSSLYGNNAFAGVINIITDEPKSGFKGEVIASYETHNTFDNNANISYRKKKIL
jgi:outer membrane receptor for ferrienterochelin and colicins